MKSLTGILTLSLALAACGRSHERNDNGSSGALPNRTGGLNPPTYSPAVDQSGSGLSSLTLSGFTIVVDLTTAPIGTNNWAPSSCASVLPANFIIGMATCTTDATKTVAITAADARQICSGNPNLRTVEPVAAPAIAGCNALSATFYGFTPAISITLVPRA